MVTGFGGKSLTAAPQVSGPTAWLESIMPEPWARDALCAETDPEAFFPEKGGSTLSAKRICWGSDKGPGCPVRDQCLAYAMDRDERFGIWGGYSERERRRLRRSIDIGEEVPASGWSAAEDSLLRRLVRLGRSNGEIARTLHRKATTIASRRAELGLPPTAHTFGGSTATSRKGA